jgi:hypothetical protein
METGNGLESMSDTKLTHSSANSSQVKENEAAGPVSRILSAGSPAGRSFLWAAHCCGALATYPEVERAEPARVPAEAETPSLFGLAPCGVCPARDITAAAVRSYRTFSPLPRRRSKSARPQPRCSRSRTKSGAPGRAWTHNDVEAVCFLWHFPSTGLDPGLPDVIRHTALRSSDFPPRPLSKPGQF